MTTTERAARVLQEIDAALALAGRPWEYDTCTVISRCGIDEEDARSHVDGGFYRVEVEGNPDACRFIVASRTGWPKTLEMLKTAIEGIFECSHFWQAAAAMWGENHPLKDAETRALEARDAALTTLCDQWESK